MVAGRKNKCLKKIGHRLTIFLLLIAITIPALAFEITVSSDTLLYPSTRTIVIKLEAIREYPPDANASTVFFKAQNEITGEVSAVFEWRQDKSIWIGYYDYDTNQVVYIAKGSIGDSVVIKTTYDKDTQEVIEAIYYKDLKIYERRGTYYTGASKVIDKLIVDFNDQANGKADFVIKSSVGTELLDVLNLFLPALLAVAVVGVAIRYITRSC